MPGRIVFKTTPDGQQAPVERIRINSAGNVGIGQNYGLTNSRLVVAGQSAGADGAYATGRGSIVLNETNRASVNDTGGLEFKASIFGSGYGAKIIGLDNGTLAFGNRDNSASFTERARIDSGGNLLVGTTSSGGEIGRLTVKQGEDADNGGLRLIAPNSTNAWAVRTGSDSNLYFGYNGTPKARIDNSSGAYNALSDARLKENVEESAKGLSEILALRPVSYTFIDDQAKNEQLGFIAQEVEPVIPQVVSTPTSSNQYYGLNYAGVVPVLVKAIQEQQALIASQSEIISAQQTALTALTARVEALEGAQA
jgi:hypothetical protein